MDAVDETLKLLDELNPDDWKAYNFAELQNELAQLKGLQMLIENTIGGCERIIRTHEVSPEYNAYVRAKEDRTMLKERSSRLQRMSTQVQTLLKTP
jgi:hypothetical protein